jgi:hypothetical protein
MTQAELEQAVAQATGESRRTVQHLGFSVADPDSVDHDPEPPRRGRIVDWDELDAQRVGLFP